MINVNFIKLHVLVKLIGVNKGRNVPLKYFSILINVNRKHRLYSRDCQMSLTDFRS